jgi:hypothetical protein
VAAAGVAAACLWSPPAALPAGPRSTVWELVEADTAPRVLGHDLSNAAPRRGAPCERIEIEAAAGSVLRLQTAVGPAAVIDEFAASVWIRANRPGIRLAARVVLPDFVSQKTGRPVTLLLPGTISRDADRWEQVHVGGLPASLAERLPALHQEHGPHGGTANAAVTHLVLDLYSTPGRYAVSIDEVAVSGGVAPDTGVARRIRDPQMRPAAAEAAGPPSDPPAGLARGVVEVGGLPFFPRALDHNGEPLAAIAALGFNCVRLAEPATGDLLAEARAAGLWVICPPPAIPDIDVRDPEAVPVLRNWDRVLMWDLGSGLTASDVNPLAEQARRVRACDLRAARPLIASADADQRGVSRHVDMLVARRTVLGTSLELADYVTWLRERPRLTRPGTPLLATLSTEIDPQAARQAAALAGVGGRGLAVDPESLCLASLSAVAAGTRGILFSSSRRIDADDGETRLRAAAARETNLRLATLEPWAAAGRFSATAQTSDPEVQAVVMEAARARMVIVWRCVQGAQICPRHYEGALPAAAAVTILVPGVPEPHQAWEVGPGGLRPLRQRRATGGMAVTLDDFASHALVLISGEPAVTGHVQDRLRQSAAAELASARNLAGLVLAEGAALLARLPAAALGNLPVAAMLGAAQREALDAEALAATDPAAAVGKFRRCAAICGQFERLAWERGVQGTGSLLSLMASPLAVADSTLAEQWRFSEALATAVPGANLLAGGGMERIDDLTSSGWRHFAQQNPDIRTSVEIARDRPFAGAGCLRIAARAARDADAPVVLETPPVWITTPPLAAPAGRLLEISARVWVPAPIGGSVDGLLVFDSLGGPALAERIGVTRDWTRLTLYRIVPADADPGPLVVTFAVTGLGEALVDDVAVRVLERGGGGTPATAVSTATPSGFPGPADLLGGTATEPPTAALPRPAPPAFPPPAATRAPQWPGMSLEWPQLLPFGQSADAPPPGVGGGTIDPFKRARAVGQPAP